MPKPRPAASLPSAIRAGGEASRTETAQSSPFPAAETAPNSPRSRSLPELLCPAGDMDRLEAALTYGADACYLGGSTLSLRAGTQGFDSAALAQACTTAHARGAAIYYTLNILPHETHLAAVAATLEHLAASDVDGIIIADPGVLRMARRYAPEKTIHLSTQANTANSEAVGFWHDMGVRRVNLARELDARAIRHLARTYPDMELEVFVHGAMCLALSGRCLLSAWLNRRPANLGECTHPCRFEYRATNAACAPCPPHNDSLLCVEEKTRNDGSMWEITREEPYSAFWAPEDLCLVRYVPWFIRTGIASLKVEGRMKTPGYVAHVTDVYRTALNEAAAGTFRPQVYLAELLNTASRPLTTGFFLPAGRRAAQQPLSAQQRRPIVAQVCERLGDSAWRVAVRSPWTADRSIQIMLPGLRRPELDHQHYQLENHRGETGGTVHPGMDAILRCESPLLQTGIFLR